LSERYRCFRVLDCVKHSGMGPCTYMVKVTKSYCATSRACEYAYAQVRSRWTAAA
jgi:hypothetical protein